MRPPQHRTAKAEQRGAALMLMLVVVVMGIAAVLISSLNATRLKNARQETTAAALAQAKDALIGYAVSDSNRPGELPCPDVNDDGKLTMNVDYIGGNCVSLIGRIPWITLGLPELLDGDAERLWYALSDPFHANGSGVLNSNTKGTLPVYRSDGTTLQTEAGYDAVAVIFSPGSVLESQARSTVAERNSAANYLDTANGRNNASASGPFIAGSISDTFNDQLLFITTRNLMPLVEQRVAGAVKKALTDYYAANGYYPWADNLLFGPDNYAANDKTNRGWLPRDAAAGGNPTTPDWVADSLPQWFFDNKWYSLVYYSVARDYTRDPSDCDTCDNSTLSVDGVNGARVLFFMPGTPIGTLVRNAEYLPHYLEDSQNKDHDDDLYVTPTSQAADRDRLHWLSSSSMWQQ